MMGSNQINSCTDFKVTGEEKLIMMAQLYAAFELKFNSSVTAQQSKENFNSCPSAQKELLKKTCKNFIALSEKSGDEEVLGNQFCCKALDICPPPFYTQIWFFSACGGFVLLLIIIILIVIICCRKK